MEPVQGLNLNRQYISGLQPEIPGISSSYGNDFALSFSVERTERYSVFPLEKLIEDYLLIIIDSAKNVLQFYNMLLVMTCKY